MDDEVKDGSKEFFDCSNCKHQEDLTVSPYCIPCVKNSDRTLKPTRWEPIEDPVIPKPINNTTELDEIHNHIQSIAALLEGLRLKSRFPRQRQQIALVRESLNNFEITDIKAVEESFEG